MLNQDTLLKLCLKDKECPCIAKGDGVAGCALCGSIDTPHSKHCENCRGTGRIPLLDQDAKLRLCLLNKKCSNCNGEGSAFVTPQTGNIFDFCSCSWCGGTGRIPLLDPKKEALMSRAVKCPVCEGTRTHLGFKPWLHFYWQQCPLPRLWR